MMSLYQFHQFLKRYSFVHEAVRSHQFEMVFVEVAPQKLKKLDFLQFGTVLAKIALKIYVGEDHKQVELLDPVGLLLRLVNDYLRNEKQMRDPSPEATKQGASLDSEFERFRLQFEHHEVYKLMMTERKALERIFDGYTKASKRGVKIVPLRQFKWMLRDLSVIPHITTEYKCAQLFKYLD